MKKLEKNKGLFNKKVITLWLPLIIYLFLIFNFSTKSEPLPSTVSVSTNYLHPIEFFILAFLVLRIFHAYNIKNKYILTILLVTLIGIADETVQSFIPGRTASLMDVLFDLIGALFILLFKKFEKILEIY